MITNLSSSKRKKQSLAEMEEYYWDRILCALSVLVIYVQVFFFVTKEGGGFSSLGASEHIQKEL